ncbi:lysine transporter LysE [Endozoicomonas sp. OPT23]|uniref:LysE family translocator n=1 Tax=Endozoicomonas sp. OPT23 TaxID=2072845 RepID=UPI00129A2E38|nr:LysE family translocator [Endozoicomonas sp. OPT23]MRI33564.1 lysine transporter LysE [Endozoicomonas sp. OPT23]
MTLASWLSLLAICVLGAVSPGPSLAAVMKSTLQGSRTHGMVTAISHAFGIGLYAFLVAAGIAVVITETLWLFQVITYAGAAYLAWMGYKSLASKSSLVNEEQNTGPSISFKQSALDGFLISFLNPKIAVFFLALFSQFVTPETTLITQLLMALMATLCDGIWYCMIAGVAGHAKVLPMLRRNATMVNRICGALLIFVALRILAL